jgi:hypothetical protein
MARLLPGLLALGMAWVLIDATAHAVPGSGSPAPAFTLRQIGGGQLTLAGLKGHVVLLSFWTPG